LTHPTHVAAANKGFLINARVQYQNVLFQHLFKNMVLKCLILSTEPMSTNNIDSRPNNYAMFVHSAIDGLIIRPV
jgi:hypothetical protein